MRGWLMQKRIFLHSKKLRRKKFENRDNRSSSFWKTSQLTTVIFAGTTLGMVSTTFKLYFAKERRKRVQLFLRFMYGWTRYMRYVPVKYVISNSDPDSVVAIDSVGSTCFGIGSAMVLGPFIAYWYYEAFFGETSTFESLLLVGCNGIFNIMLMSQVWFLLPSTRISGTNVMNAALQAWHRNSKDPPLSYEIICFILSWCSVLYPVLYLPIIFVVSWIFPSVLRSLNLGIDLIVSGINPNPDLLALFTCFFRLVIYAPIATALGHGLVNCFAILHWILTYFYITAQNLEAMSSRLRKG